MTEPSQNYTDIIEQLKSKIRILENENRLLKKRLCEAGISYVDEFSDHNDQQIEAYDPDQGERIKKFQVTDKIANDFFIMFCRGRKDVYSLRYMNPKTGRIGYYTQYRKKMGLDAKIVR